MKKPICHRLIHSPCNMELNQSEQLLMGQVDQGFSVSALSTFWPTCTVECVAAALFSTRRCHYHPFPQCDSPKCLHTLPNVPWRAKLSLAEPLEYTYVKNVGQFNFYIFLILNPEDGSYCKDKGLTFNIRELWYALATCQEHLVFSFFKGKTLEY